MLKRALVIGATNPDAHFATTLHDLAAIYQIGGKLAKAKPLYEQALRHDCGESLSPKLALVRQAELLEDRDESGLFAIAIVRALIAHVREDAVTLGVRFLQPQQRFVFVAQTGVNG